MENSLGWGIARARRLEMISRAWVANPVINKDASIRFFDEKISESAT